MPIGVVGVAGAEGLQDVAVILAALVGVLDQQADGGAGGLALINTREDFHRIGLVALGHKAAGAGAAPVQVGLDVGRAQGHAGRTAVDHAADGRAVRFPEVGDCEKMSEGIAAHGADYPRVQGLWQFGNSYQLLSADGIGVNGSANVLRPTASPLISLRHPPQCHRQKGVVVYLKFMQRLLSKLIGVVDWRISN